MGSEGVGVKVRGGKGGGNMNVEERARILRCRLAVMTDEIS